MAAKFPNHRDPKYWRLGFLYYNPQDPNLFVDRRLGTGVTINFGHKGAWGIIAVLLMAPAAAMIMLLTLAR